jgi:hypothetical protein
MAYGPVGLGRVGVNGAWGGEAVPAGAEPAVASTASRMARAIAASLRLQRCVLSRNVMTQYWMKRLPGLGMTIWPRSLMSAATVPGPAGGSMVV